MSKTMEEVLDRVRKLLRLKEHAGSEAEAALAAQRAAEMMVEHEIDEAVLRQSLDGNVRSTEPIDEEVAVTNTRKRVAWQMNLIEAVATNHHCHAYWRNGKVVLFGRQSNCQAASYVSQYLIRQVNELAVAEAAKNGVKGKLADRGHSRAWYNAFKIGASHRISVRLGESRTVDRSCDPLDNNSTMPAPSEGVMVLVQQDRQEVDDAYSAFAKREFRGYGASVGNISNRGAYVAGVKAGNTVSLGNQARGGLPRGTGILK